MPASATIPDQVSCVRRALETSASPGRRRLRFSQAPTSAALRRPRLLSGRSRSRWLGLFVSYRGALAFRERLDLPPGGPRPCDICAAPCRSACPVGALGGGGYDVAGCHSFLDSAPGRDCLDRGCAVRRACPVGADLRPEAQSAFHMRDFHGKRS